MSFGRRYKLSNTLPREGCRPPGPPRGRGPRTPPNSISPGSGRAKWSGEGGRGGQQPPPAGVSGGGGRPPRGKVLLNLYRQPFGFQRSSGPHPALTQNNVGKLSFGRRWAGFHQGRTRGHYECLWHETCCIDPRTLNRETDYKAVSRPFSVRSPKTKIWEVVS